MNAKIMEGLSGAGTNMNLVGVPMKVFRKAVQDENAKKMQRSANVAGELKGKADKYQVKAKKGMAEQAEEAREKAKAAREEAIEKRRNERVQKDGTQPGRETDTRQKPDKKMGAFVQISNEGKEKARLAAEGSVRQTAGIFGKKAVQKQPMIFMQAGKKANAIYTGGQ